MHSNLNCHMATRYGYIDNRYVIREIRTVACQCLVYIECTARSIGYSFIQPEVD